MRSVKELAVDIVRKPPLLFPMVGGAHVLWTLWVLWGLRSAPLGGLEWLGAAWMLAYTICWLAACDLRRWGAMGYIILTLLNVTLFITLKSNTLRDVYQSPIFLLDGIFSFFLLFFYRRFR